MCILIYKKTLIKSDVQGKIFENAKPITTIDIIEELVITIYKIIHVSRLKL